MNKGHIKPSLIDLEAVQTVTGRKGVTTHRERLSERGGLISACDSLSTGYNKMKPVREIRRGFSPRKWSNKMFMVTWAHVLLVTTLT